MAAERRGRKFRTQRQLARYWLAFVVTIALLFMLTAWWIHSPGQDHIASIPLNGDGTWFHNYEIGFEIQDNDIFFHSIGHSIQNAQQADIIILGSSRALLASIGNCSKTSKESIT